MSLAQRFLLCGVLFVGLSNLQGCGGSPELAPAKSTPAPDPKKLEDARKQSMEMGKLKVNPAANPPANSGK